MRVSDDLTVPEKGDRTRIADLEERLGRIEAHLGLGATPLAGHVVVPPPALAPVFNGHSGKRGEIEFELGQRWFALAGVAVLTAGLAFLLSLPYRSLPAAVPSLAGFGICAALLAAARWSRKSLPGGANSLRAAVMVLLGFSALRLFFFGAPPALEVTAKVGHAVLYSVFAFNLMLAVRQRSPGLTLLALIIGCVGALAVGTVPMVLPTLAGCGLVAVALSRREDDPVLLLGALLVTPATYFIWAAGNPFRSGAVHFVREPAWAPILLLALIVLLGAAPLLRERNGDNARTNVGAFVNCAFGYGAFLIHTAAAFPARFAALHVFAAAALLGLAMTFFARAHSRVSTFFYAMTGYAALSFAIARAAPVPDVFVWLSVQSVVVVATAIGFRSRFIVVANFFIFAGIVLTYMVVARQESGISLGFGVVALVTARILHWKQHRLELKTEFMRNAYLVSAFVIFPYAAYHLVPVKYVALAWIGIAVLYYLVNTVTPNQKYRWMAHGTLALTTVYVIGIGISRFEPVYRVLSFLALGATLIIVSICFARVRQRQAAATLPESERPPES